MVLRGMESVGGLLMPQFMSKHNVCVKLLWNPSVKLICQTTLFRLQAPYEGLRSNQAHRTDPYHARSRSRFSGYRSLAQCQGQGKESLRRCRLRRRSPRSTRPRYRCNSRILREGIPKRAFDRRAESEQPREIIRP